MAIEYYSKITKGFYKTEEEAQKAESAFLKKKEEEQKKADELSKARKDRYNELQASFECLQKLKEEYNAELNKICDEYSQKKIACQSDYEQKLIQAKKNFNSLSEAFLNDYGAVHMSFSTIPQLSTKDLLRVGPFSIFDFFK